MAQRGLLGLPGSEAIYRAYMRMSVHLGDPALARSTYEYLENSLSLLYPTEDRRPSPETRRLLAELLAMPSQDGPAMATAGPPGPDRTGGSAGSTGSGA